MWAAGVPGGRVNCCLYVFAVIANQCAHWCGNPPDKWNQVTITTKIAVFSRPVGKLSIHFPSNRGIATPACALARNDSKNSTNNNLSALQVGDWNLTASFLISGGGWHIMKSKIRAFGRRGKEAV